MRRKKLFAAMFAAAVAFTAVPEQNLVFAQEVPYETIVAQEEENYGTEQRKRG